MAAKGKPAALLSADVEALGLKGRILWTEGTPPSGPAAGPGTESVSDPAGPVYVLIHGIGVSHRYLARLHTVLAATAPTYSLDLPGFGGTPKPDRQLSVEDYGAFIAEALASRGIGSYVLVGHSMGAQFVIEAALHAPDRVRQVVLMGPVVDSRHKNVRRQSVALLLDGMLRESPSSNWIVTSDYFRCGPRWYLTELPVMMSYPTEKRVAGIKVPVLVLRGSRDNVAGPDWALRLSRAVDQGRLVEIPGVGHVAQHMRPHAVADAIRSFVAATALHGQAP
ncbi:pimeloyl-ACP methyl ester carboxylesterase [Arthrobacter bambusae]|uniref:Pimeloyl-ACP methyl ester carboxylesterase n=1 Tax=Arthrobacter bambusae TaxID=1338426 RepID=A0ABV2PBM1_9MICC